MEKLEMILSVERLSHNRHYSALSCIVLADYAERYYAPLELSPEWGAIPLGMGASPYQCVSKKSSCTILELKGIFYATNHPSKTNIPDS